VRRIAGLILAASLAGAPAALAQDAGANGPPASSVSPPSVASSGASAVAAAPANFVRSKIIRRPPREALAKLFPEAASRAGVSGVATASCVVSASTQLEHCKIVSESPQGYGFGDALLKILTLYRVRPPTLNGQPLANDGFALQFSFQALPRSASSLTPPRVVPRPPVPVPAPPDVAPPAPADLQPPSTPAPIGPAPTPVGPARRAIEALWAPIGFGAAVLIALSIILFSPNRRAGAQDGA
jgi:hypothetical protein